MKNQFNKNNEKMKKKKLLSFPFFSVEFHHSILILHFWFLKQKKGLKKISATTYKVGGGTMPLGRSR